MWLLQHLGHFRSRRVLGLVGGLCGHLRSIVSSGRREAWRGKQTFAPGVADYDTFL